MENFKLNLTFEYTEWRSLKLLFYTFRYSFAPRKAQQELSPGELLLDKTCKLCQHKISKQPKRKCKVVGATRLFQSMGPPKNLLMVFQGVHEASQIGEFSVSYTEFSN